MECHFTYLEFTWRYLFYIWCQPSPSKFTHLSTTFQYDNSWLLIQTHASHL